MPTVYEEGTPEREYIDMALKAGQAYETTALILFLAKFTGKKPQEVQSDLTDARVGIEQVRRDWREAGVLF